MTTGDGEVKLSGEPCISLTLASRPETLTLVRAMLSGVAELLRIDAELLDDLKTAVSEACNNVVVHAYPSKGGPLEVELFVVQEALTARVADRGVGLHTVQPLDDTSLGVGIAVIRALAEVSDFRAGEVGGTEVLMQFAARRDGELLFSGPGEPTREDGFARQLSGDAVVSVSPVHLIGAVMGRLARTLAASARFSLDRFSDVYLVTDALAELLAAEAVVDRASFALRALPRRLEVEAGPVQAGTIERVRQEAARQPRPSPLCALTDELSAAHRDEDEELVRVVMLDRQR